METLKMNPFSFNGRSGSLNFLVYGIVLPLTIVGIGFLTGYPQIGIGGMLISFMMSLATIVRRGRDVGNTPTVTLVSLVLSSWLISELMAVSFMSLKIMAMSGSFIVGVVIVAIIQNIYLVYLLIAKKSDKEVPETGKRTKAILMIFGVVLIVGILAAVALPKFAQAKSELKGHKEKVCFQMNQLNVDIRLHRINTGSYPSIDTMPTDPWGTPYHYYPIGDSGSKAILLSYGSDKQRATADDILLSGCNKTDQ